MGSDGFVLTPTRKHGILFLFHVSYRYHRIIQILQHCIVANHKVEKTESEVLDHQSSSTTGVCQIQRNRTTIEQPNGPKLSLHKGILPSTRNHMA